MPPIYGLYTSVLTTSTYLFFGSSQQLTVGPTAVVSLLTGTIIAKYCGVYNSSKNLFVDGTTTHDVEYAVDTAAQAAFCIGIVIFCLGLVNMGHAINFLSHSVMSGFTSGAALTIGLTQLKSAFGMSAAVPSPGQEGYEYNYMVIKWWIDNFNGQDTNGRWYRNHYAVSVIFLIMLALV